MSKQHAPPQKSPQKPKSVTVGVSSTASGTGSRPGEFADSGHWMADEHIQNRMSEYQEEGGGGVFGQVFAQVRAVAEAAGIVEANQITQTTLDQVPPELLDGLDPDTILRFAFSPEDMAGLDLQGEHDAIAEVAPVLTVNNPSPELMNYLVQSGQFEDMIWSGHGDSEGMWITNDEGKAELLPAADLATMFEGSSVDEMLLNVCNGGEAVAEAMADVGVDTFGYDRLIDDKEAMEDAVQFAEQGSLEAIDTGAEVRWGEEGGGMFGFIPLPEIRTGGQHRSGRDRMAELVGPMIGQVAGALGGMGGPAAAMGAQAGVDAGVSPDTGPQEAQASEAGAGIGGAIGAGLGAVAKSVGQAGKVHTEGSGAARNPLAAFQVGGMMAI